MPTYAYPQVRELREIGAEKLARAAEGRVGLQVLPIRNVNAGIIQWTQRDNYSGLQSLRGLDGAPFHVQHDGKSTFTVQPGVFGEFMTIGENELTNRAGSVTGESVIDLSDAIMERQDILINRELDRIEAIVWALLVTGTYAVSSDTGVGLSFTDTFTLQTHTASDWSTAATATPLLDFRTVQQKAAGYSVTFGSSAKAYMNRVTANRLLGNTNAADLGGKRTLGGGTINSIAETNRILMGEDLPEIVIYDQGYFASKSDAGSNTLTKYIPDDKVVVVGARTNGEVIGEYRMTRNAANPGYAPGSYDIIKDFTGNAPDGSRHVPPRIEIHRGHNGGPVLYHPSAICVMSV